MVLLVYFAMFSTIDVSVDLVPDAVGSLVFVDIRDTSVNVTWTAPENINGELTGKMRFRCKQKTLTAYLKLHCPYFI